MKKRHISLAAVLVISAILAVSGCGNSTEKQEAAQEKSPTEQAAVQAEKQEAAQVEEQEVMSAPVTVEGRAEDDPANLKPSYSYTLSDVFEVDGRQGIAWEDGKYYVSGSTTLSCYDAEPNSSDPQSANLNAANSDSADPGVSDFGAVAPDTEDPGAGAPAGTRRLITSNDDPFKNFEIKVNHLGDIDVYNGSIYAGAENFTDGNASDIQIAVYDAETLEMTGSYLFDETSGQTECSGIAVDPDSGSILICSWASDDSGRYIYRYDLTTGKYLGKHHLQMTPQWIQGIAYYDGWLYITADDGTADLGEPDHVYKCKVDTEKTAWTVSLERTLDDVKMQGEIEGISFDKDNDQMLVSYNRGSRIVLGMVKGFYEGYTEEIHEIYVYDMQPFGR